MLIVINLVLQQVKEIPPNLESFERDLITSQDLDKLDAEMVKKWNDDKQMNFVNYTVGYRLEISKSKRKNFLNRRYDLKVGKGTKK